MWATGVSNPIGSPHFRGSVSIYNQVSAFAFEVPTHILSFYRSLGHSLTHIIIQESKFLFACLINHTNTIRTKLTTYPRFIPSPYAQHSPSLSYRGGWHRVCQGLFFLYFQKIIFVAQHFAKQGFFFKTEKIQRLRQFAFSFRTSSFHWYFTQKCLIKLSLIVKDSALLPQMRMGLVSVPLWPFSR